jgi:hypothetical protein
MSALRPVVFVTGNAKKLEEVIAIIGNSVPLISRKIDRMFVIRWEAALL